MPRAVALALALACLAFSAAGGGGGREQSAKPGPPEETGMIQGLRTVVYHVADLEKAKRWYAGLLGRGPYFDEPFYVGFDVGGYELGLSPDASKAAGGGSAYAYWGVKDCKAAYRRLLELGAKPNTPPEEVGGGVVVATVLDPWGNVFGVVENPHFKAEAAGE